MIRRLATSLTRATARKLRKNPPAIEVLLWQLLRRKQIAGFKFHRRAIVLGSIPDFWCPSAKLAVEIDGIQSEWKSVRDARRDAQYEQHGIRTLHVPSQTILRNPAAAILLVRTALEGGKPIGK